ncbi:N utilization substance protein B [Natronospira proteinivora]|uniref:Transcription antitermination protein NusB n=1 Tax=Natronospira proteinivora TaxID=1807133 RepID=A0ABT1G766_9GAMM|nr:transcription antitermination factor NusB [Natronospira proteinivora]MCP1727140.1 N utilization substance protein B [Natronospira proteinivora]
MSETREIAQRRSRARHLAVQAVYQWQLADTDTADLLAQFHEEDGMDRADGEYFDALVRQCLADPATIKSQFDAFLDRPEVQLDPVERAILMVATLELRDRIEVPWRVVLDEAVSLARRFGADDSHRFINAVLDRAAAELRKTERGR